MHCCNAQGVMGAGIARQIKEAFPESYAYYKSWCETGRKGEWLLGRNVIHSNVINAIGQHQVGTGKQVHYGAIASCIADLHERKEIRNAGMNMRPVTVAVPYLMGCGLAGGDREIVEELLQAKPSFVSLHVYHLEDL
jgi:hypothetical protein